MLNQCHAIRGQQVIDELTAHRETLQVLGVRSLALFGSAVRNELTSNSDLDFLVELTQDRFDTYMDVKEFLESTFRRKVDLVVRSALKPGLRAHVLREAVDVPGF